MIAPSKGRVGKFYTICIVCDCSKNTEAVDPKRELTKNDFTFIDGLYDLFIRHPIGIVG